MGAGIDAARSEAPELAAALDDFKDQLLIVLIKRLGGIGGGVQIPVAECDDTGGYVMFFSVENDVFNFTVAKKH